MKLKGWYEKNKLVALLSILFAVVFIIIAGCIFAQSLFYDQWIWKYYWGPIVSDAAGHSVSWNGVYANEGYTLVSELTYGIILIIALYAIYKLLKRLEITVDWRFALALMPYILFGPVTRVLEDADYFNEPFVYWFISPLIYLQIAVYALGFLIIGYYLEKLSKRKSHKTILTYLLSIFVIVDVCYTIVYLLEMNYGTYIVNPLMFYLLSFFAFVPVLYGFLKQKNLTVNTAIFSGGLLILLPSLYLTGRWIAGYQWGLTNGVRFDVFVLISGIVALIATAVYLVSRKYKDNEKIAVYKKPLNISMIVGHMIDGLTSYVSIYDPLKMGLPLYMEKHPASNILMEIWPPLFPIVKFLLIIAVIYIFDILYKEELKNYRTLANLLKIGILILGFSPGLRDLLRVTMGV
ncbi:MAG: DUF63 family protein [Thermoplasmatales archaeon]|nr:DUF63 family protein [Thermoplasmatales archaeon]